MARSQELSYAQELQEEMEIVLHNLKDRGASEAEIKACRKGFMSEIREEVAQEKREAEQVKRFQDALRKRGCKDTGLKIKKAFFPARKKNMTSSSSYLWICALQAMQELRARSIKKAFSKDPKSKKFLGKLMKLKNALHDVRDIMSDADIQRYYERRAYKQQEVSSSLILKSHNEFFKQVTQRELELSLVLDKEAKRGRPPNEGLYRYVYQLALAYGEITGDDFTLDKHKATSGPDKGKYIALTDGHAFVCEAVRWMHEEFMDEFAPDQQGYTDVHVFHACASASELINKTKNS